MDLDLSQGIDRLDQLFVGPLGPQNLHEFQGRGQRFLRDDVLEEILESESLDVLPLEQRFQRGRISIAYDQVLIEQKQPLLHGAQYVRCLLTSLAQVLVLPLPGGEQQGDQCHQHGRDRQTAEHEEPQFVRRPGIGRLQLAGRGGQLGVQERQGVAA